MELDLRSPYKVIVKYLLYILLIVTPLLRGSVFPWHQALISVFAILMVGLLLLEKGVTSKPEFRRLRLNRPLIGIIFLFSCSFIFTQGRADSLDALTQLVSYVAIFFSTLYCIRSRDDQRELVSVIVGIACLLCLIGFFKIFGLTLPLWQYDELHYPQEFLSGVYGNHNHMAGYLEMTIPLALVLFLTRAREGFALLGLYVVVGFLLLCHVLTLSRGGWFSLAIGLSFMVLVLAFHKKFRKKKLLLVFGAAGLTVGIFILAGSSLFDRAFSLTDDDVRLGMGGRMIIWESTILMIKEHILIGSGPGTYATIFPQFQLPGTLSRFYYAHNDYLQYLSELGVFFIPIMLWTLYAIFIPGFRKLKSQSRQTWGITLGAMAGIVAILAHSLVDFNLHIPANAILFIVLVAIVVGGPVLKRK
ncbi:O-antigen ligase family protein [Desulforhopalus sp. 52FAK]